jgi:hypothetical protein
MNQPTQSQRDLVSRLKPYMDIVGSLDFIDDDDDVVVSYLLSERSRETDAAFVVHLDEWISPH